MVLNFYMNALRFYEYGYFAISVQKFYETLALKKFQKPKLDQTFSETLSALVFFGRAYSLKSFYLKCILRSWWPHFVNETKGSARNSLRFAVSDWLLGCRKVMTRILSEFQGCTDSYSPYFNWKTSFLRPLGSHET